MNALPPLHYIPLTRTRLLRACLDETLLEEESRAAFERICRHLDAHCQHEFRELKEKLKAAYALRDPDSDPATGTIQPSGGESADFEGFLAALLERANYTKISRQALSRAFELSSLFDLQLRVDTGQFAQVLLYYRGVTACEEERRSWFGLVRRTLAFNSYDRVVLFLRFSSEPVSSGVTGAYPPGSIMLKLFQNVPENDLEMLFPNTRVGMRMKDKLMIGVPALISGVTVVTTRVGVTLGVLFSLAGFWLGLRSEPVTLDRATLLAVLGGLGAVLAYLWKQFSKYRNRKLKFSQALTESLYFKLLDNNAGVLLRLVDEAEDAEFKECMLASCFLLAEAVPTGAADLERSVEVWLDRRCQRRVDFDVEDALRRLHALGIACQESGRWQIAPHWRGAAGA
jgi:hypothetical protein